MPIINHPNYKPNLILRNGHFNTIYPQLFRKELAMDYHRITLDTPDQDFIDIDVLMGNNHRLLILCHGLEGDSSSKYIQYTARLCHNNSWDVIAINYRGCSGIPNKRLQMYHSGFTNDLHMVVESYKENYEEISIAGFSLGGNILMKYLGDQIHPIDEKIKSAVAVSVPCDLSAGAHYLKKWDNYLYEQKFLITLKEKVKKKHQLFPNDVQIDKLDKVKNVIDFDEYFTGPIHGFAGAEDYYNQSHCKQFLKNIEIPSLIINALDDPFLPEACYPYAEAVTNNFIKLLTPKHGGHVGFVDRSSEYYWEEKLINTFINDPNAIA